jgi:hypothetical protein
MANEISYQVIEVQAHSLVVRYTMGAVHADLNMQYAGQPLDEWLKANTPRGLLKSLSSPPLNPADFMGKSGTTDLDLKQGGP